VPQSERARPDTPAAAGISRRPFGATAAGEPVEAFTLANGRGVEVRFIAYGGTILSVRVPDRDGATADVTLGLDALADYERDRRYLGALIGRYANRIAGGRFTLDGTEHAVTRNDGANHLHGGRRGFHAAVWDVEPFADGGAVGAALRHTSPDGEDGYPGTLRVRVTYTLTPRDELVVDYHAVTDRATPVSLTHHAYFNLAGHDAGDVLGHELTLAASRYTPVGAGLIPTGELRDVRGTPFDFTAPAPLGARIDADDGQLRLGGGYDHNFVLDRAAPAALAPAALAPAALAPAARVREPRSGRVLEVHTTEPGIQLYSGNHVAHGPAGKGGHAYGARAGLALEPQRFPDSPNQPAFPSAVLRPGEAYTSRTVYRFAVDGGAT
jgi:aldose 1-epimerase